MSDAVLAKLDEIKALLSEGSRNNRVLSVAEAAEYCGFASTSGFLGWVKKLRRNPPLHGRYPQPVLDEWLAQECRIRPKK